MASSVIGALRVNLGLDSAQFNKGAKQAQTTAQRLGRNMQRIGAAASVVGAGVALAIRGQLNAADDLGKSAQQLGLPVEQLSQLQHAAKLSGVSMSSLETGLRRLSQNMAQDAEKFSALGIAVRDANGEMRPTADVMADLSNVLADMPDGAEKTALAMDLMGRSGAEMIPLLNGGADSLKAMMAEADALGLTISGETAAAAAQFNDNLTRLSGLVQGVVRIMSAEFAPVLATISDAVAGFAERFQNLSPQMRRFIGVAGAIAIALGPVLIALGTLVIVVGAISAPVLLAVGAIAAITAGLVAFWPEIVAAKDALVGMIEDGIEAAKTAFENARQAISDFTERMIDLGNRGIDFVKEKLRELVAFLSDLPARFREAGANLMSGLTEGISDGASRARDAIGNVVTGLRNRFSRDTETRSPSRLFARLGGFLMDGLALGIREKSGAPVEAMSDVASSLGDVDAASFDLGQSLSGLFTDALTGAKNLNDGLKDLLSSMSKMFLNQAFSQFFDRVLPSFNFGCARAMGGPVSAGSTYLVGERGPELFTPSGGGNIVPNHRLGGGTTVQVINNTGAPVREERSRGPDGREIIRTIIGEEIGSGRMDKPMGRYGLSPAKVRR